MESLLQEIRDRYHDTHDLFGRNVNPKMMKVLQLLGFDEAFVDAQGCYLLSRDGQRFLDFHSGEGATTLGYNHPQVTSFLSEIVELRLPNMIQLNCNVLAGLLAEKLLAKAPANLGKVYFTSSGAETVESALKFARCATGRNRIVYCRQAFHGLTYGALSVCGDEEFKQGFGNMMPDTTMVEFNDLRALEIELAKGPVAAFITEPVQGREVTLAEAGFLRDAAALCRKYGALFILDEIQTGLGRTGTFFALEQHDVTPDILLVAKALSGGLVPVGAMLYTNHVYERVYSSLDRCYVHHSTYGFNTMAMAAGLATLQVIEEHALVDNAKRMGERIMAGLDSLQERYEMLHAVRGSGLMFAIELTIPKSRISGTKWRFIEKAAPGLFPQMVVIPLFKKHGIICMVSGFNNVVKFIPPLTIGETEVDYFLQSLDEVLHECIRSNGPRNTLLGIARRATAGALNRANTSY